MTARTYATGGAAALITVLAAGCAGSGRNVTPSPFAIEPHVEASQVSIAVRNHNWNDARLYAWSAGQRIPLGTVAAFGDARYELDWDLTLPMSIEIQLVPGPTCRTRQIQVDAGDELEVQIPASSSRRDFCR